MAPDRQGRAAAGRSRRHGMGATLLIDLALESDPGLPWFFLERLASLLARQAAAASPTERQALGLAAFSVFLDCLDLGFGAEAHAILGQFRDAERSAARPAA